MWSPCFMLSGTSPTLPADWLAFLVKFWWRVSVLQQWLVFSQLQPDWLEFFMFSDWLNGCSNHLHLMAWHLSDLRGDSLQSLNNAPSWLMVHSNTLTCYNIGVADCMQGKIVSCGSWQLGRVEGQADKLITFFYCIYINIPFYTEVYNQSCFLMVPSISG